MKNQQKKWRIKQYKKHSFFWSQLKVTFVCLAEILICWDLLMICADSKSEDKLSKGLNALMSSDSKPLKLPHKSWTAARVFSHNYVARSSYGDQKTRSTKKKRSYNLGRLVKDMARVSKQMLKKKWCNWKCRAARPFEKKKKKKRNADPLWE